MFTAESEELCRLIDQRAQDARVFDELTKEPPAVVPVYWTVSMVSTDKGYGRVLEQQVPSR